MATFTAATKNPSAFPTRAPAQSRVGVFVAITCSDPNDSCDLYSDDCRTHAQLVSPSRDPIGYIDGYNIYRAYYVPTGLDPLGLYSLQDAADSLRKQGIGNPSSQQIFDEWVRLERSRGNWWNGLPKCPCKLNPRMKFCLGSAWSDGFENPDDSLWGDPYVPTTAEESLHPGIAYSMRSKGGPPTNQCTYDATGNLHLNPPMAGTVDSELPGTLPHLSQDVDPIGLANSLDGGCPVNIWTMPWGKCKVLNPPGPNMMKYYRVRPLWAEPCGRPNFNMQIPWVKLSKRIGGLVQANIH